jgi:hypothetical protein
MMRTLSIMAACLGCFQIEASPANVIPPPQNASATTAPQTDYTNAIASITSARHALAQAYSEAKRTDEMARILSKARSLFVSSAADNLFPYWYGTPWDFNGTTEEPGKGKIACGYFVTTVLRDIGLRVERTRMAQQPSELIIKSLTSENYIRRYSNVPNDKFVAAVREWGSGLYVVGLDQHTGFILCDNQGVFFIHSSYVGAKVVAKERALDSPILSGSKYRVIGKLSADDEFLRKWLQGGNFSTQMLEAVSE